MRCCTCIYVFLLVSLPTIVAGFQLPLPPSQSLHGVAWKGDQLVLLQPRPSLLCAKKQKPSKSKSGSGAGGFGAAKAASTSNTIAADKTALEKQWDTFAAITDLEVKPKTDSDDDFEVVDVFVRFASKEKQDIGDAEKQQPGTGFFRVGKVVAADGVDIAASLTLHKGLIFWTAVHMWPQLVAAGGKSCAALLELGYTSPAAMAMAAPTDGPLNDKDATDVKLSGKVSVKGVSLQRVGFRPDFNPSGFTYKRREKDALKKKKSNLQEIAEAG